MRLRTAAGAVAAGVLAALLTAVAPVAPSAAIPETPTGDSERFALVVGVSDYAGRTKSTVGLR